MSKFVLLDLNCNNGNFFGRVLHNTYASQSDAVARRNRNFQYFSCC